MRRILVCGLAAAWFCRRIPPVSVEVPIARLLRNLGAYVEANPKDAEGHYLLGRLHASAFLFGVTKQLRVAADKDGRMLPFQLPWLSPRAPILRPRKNLDKTLSEEDRYHLASTVREYRLAIELSSDQPVAYKLTAADTYLRPSNKPLAYLGLGWILEQAAAFRRDDRSSWIEQAFPTANATRWVAASPRMIRMSVRPSTSRLRMESSEFCANEFHARAPVSLRASLDWIHTLGNARNWQRWRARQRSGPSGSAQSFSHWVATPTTRACSIHGAGYGSISKGPEPQLAGPG